MQVLNMLLIILTSDNQIIQDTFSLTQPISQLISYLLEDCRHKFNSKQELGYWYSCPTLVVNGDQELWLLVQDNLMVNVTEV